jgi:hypothetical protein
LASTSIDLFDLMSVGDFKAANHERWTAMHGSQKQKRMTPVDERMLAAARDRLELADAAVLHPELMYKHLNYYWRGVIGLGWYESLTAGAPLSLPDLGVRQQLPDDYFAAKFYFRPSFPDTADNRQFIAAFVRSLARIKPVVLIETGIDADDHAEYIPGDVLDDDRVRRLRLGDSPARNLALQSEVIGRSSAFFGTYGGMTYLPMQFDVPSFGIVSDEEHVWPLHATAASQACAVLRRDHGHRRATFTVLTTAEARTLLLATNPASHH